MKWQVKRGKWAVGRGGTARGCTVGQTGLCCWAWPAVCTAHITHSIESRPTLHTLLEITEALINSPAEQGKGSKVGQGVQKGEAEGKLEGEVNEHKRQGRGDARGICWRNKAFMEHVKLKCIRRHHRRRHGGQRKWLFNGAAEVLLPSFLFFLLVSFFFY